MNVDGFTPAETALFSGLVEQDDPTKLPHGVAALSRNMKYHLNSVRQRDGVRAEFGFNTGAASPVTGLIAAKYSANPDVSMPIAFDAAGNIKLESPAGSGQAIPLTGAQFLPAAGQSMQGVSAFQKVFMGFTDLKKSVGAPAVFNMKTGNVDPLSSLPVGAPWQPSHFYNVGEVVCPTKVGGTGHSFMCNVAGISGTVEPAWPTVEVSSIVDNQVTWLEQTPIMQQTLQPAVPATPTVTHSVGPGAFAAGRDVYIKITYTNINGETLPSGVFKFVNTAGNDRFIVTAPVLPNWATLLNTPNAPNGYGVYEADVATGGAAPTTFKLVINNPIGTNTNVDNTAAGAVAPIANTAVITLPGNICTGLRYGICLFLNRNGYISGVGASYVFNFTSVDTGLQLAVFHIPKGPAPSTQARILAFTPAGQLSQSAGQGISSAGPFFWIAPAAKFFTTSFDLSSVPQGVTVADVVNGITMNSTLINDNTTTLATFNFTDDYLKGTKNDVSSYFRKIQIPNLQDVQFMPSVQRMFYAVDALPQGWYISGQNDAETVYGDKGLIQLQDELGTRTAIREFRNVIYPMKEKGGYTLTPNAQDPSTWAAEVKWRGSGPCGPRAVDVTTEFMIYVHDTGVYVFFGSDPPRIISTELPKTWSNINWAAKQTIWVKIDETTREVYIGVPTGFSTVPNLTLVCNYEQSPTFEPPVHVTIQGELKATLQSRKWSKHTISANVCVRADRSLTSPPDDMDQTCRQSQLLFGSSNPDGQVSAMIPGLHDDSGVHGVVAMDAAYETVCHPDMLNLSRVGGLKADVDGAGDTFFTLLGGRGRAAAEGGTDPALAYLELPLVKTFNPQKTPGRPGYSCGARGANEKWRVRVSNNNTVGSWFDLRSLVLYTNPVSSAEPK